MDTDRLIENIIEQIKEAQIKLGYVKEVIRLYFPAGSLSLLLQIQEESAEVLAEQLQKESSLKDTMLVKCSFLPAKGNGWKSAYCRRAQNMCISMWKIRRFW